MVARRRQQPVSVQVPLHFHHCVFMGVSEKRDDAKSKLTAWERCSLIIYYSSVLIWWNPVTARTCWGSESTNFLLVAQMLKHIPTCLHVFRRDFNKLHVYTWSKKKKNSNEYRQTIIIYLFCNFCYDVEVILSGHGLIFQTVFLTDSLRLPDTQSRFQSEPDTMM